MKKRILYAILGLIVLAAVLGGVKVLQIRAMIDQAKKAVLPPETVTTAEVASESWETSLVSVGSLAAVQGVTVAAELAGKVVEITFEAGTKVKRGDLLIRQDTSSEEAQLPGAVAQANLARTVLTRDAEMLADRIISESDYDAAVAAYEQAMALANGIRTTIGKKTIRAPFSGRLGIRQVNLGQILREGDPIVTLQSLDPIYVNFTLPQQELGALRKAVGGDAPRAKNDGRVFPNDPFPLAALKALEGAAEIHVEKLRLADGNMLEDIRSRAHFKQGKIASDELKLRLQGRELRLALNADASSGKTLALNATLAGEKVPLAALTGLAGLAPPPEGAPTDVAVKFSGRGTSVRTLMASANGDVRIVVGAGRVRSRALDAGADVTSLLNALNPARTQDPYTELKCAVLRFPISDGIARISNGIAAETSKVRLIGGGTVNLRNETLELGFRPQAAGGLGVGAGSLARFAKVEGTLANPRVGLDMASSAGAAAAVGAAIATGGLSLLAGGLLMDSVPDNPCQVALSGVAPKDKSTVDKLLDPIKKLFGN